jgi:hypothetical protein
MADPKTSGLRRALVAVLILALTLSGIGRSVASTVDQVGGPYAIAGVPICHSGAGGPPVDPAIPSRHDCCDACALLAPAVLPTPPFVCAPASVAHYAAHARAVDWAPTVLRPRSPRQSQGPPAA